MADRYPVQVYVCVCTGGCVFSQVTSCVLSPYQVLSTKYIHPYIVWCGITLHLIEVIKSRLEFIKHFPNVSSDVCGQLFSTTSRLFIHIYIYIYIHVYSKSRGDWPCIILCRLVKAANVWLIDVRNLCEISCVQYFCTSCWVMSPSYPHPPNRECGCWGTLWLIFLVPQSSVMSHHLVGCNQICHLQDHCRL